jgi:hypothetical protein
MDTGYQNTVSGLLRKRGEMLVSIADLREQIAVLSNDMESICRRQATGMLKEGYAVARPRGLPIAPKRG